MNFSLHLDDETLARLNQAVERTGQTRNRLIGAAVREWLGRYEAADWSPTLSEHWRNPAPELESGVADFQAWLPAREA